MARKGSSSSSRSSSSKSSKKKRARSSAGGRKKASSRKKRNLKKQPTVARRSAGALGRATRQVAKWVAVAACGASMGGGFVTWTLYRQALEDVDALLDGRVWASTGSVVSAPMELWPGLRLSPAELASDLQSAGYGRVDAVGAPGDFQVSGDAVLIVGKGKAVDGTDGEVLVTFRGDRIGSLSPSSRVRLASTELAGMRGQDNEARQPVALDALPEHVPRAILAMEDARFYEHEGVDPLGIARAVVVNAIRDRPMQGGSTLTQQLVKNLSLTLERTVERKAREAILAMALESQRSKDEILELYLNEIYLGQVGGVAICGIDQAARAYFGKPATRLELGEAATLAGIVSAPNRYSPLRHPEEARERRDITLNRMADVGWLAPGVSEREKRAELQVHPTSTSRHSPWAVDAAADAVETEVGEGAIAARGLTVVTTIQPALQRLAERAVTEGLAEMEQAWPTTSGAEMALVAMRVDDGSIVALVGGRSYGESQFDRALHGRRQVGSTIKPLSALLALERDPSLSPATVFEDAPLERSVDGKTWAPRNYDGGFRGSMTLRESLRVSRNIPAVLLAEQAGLGRLQEGWQRLGLSGATANPASALGSFTASPVELASAYTVFPGRGKVSAPLLVRRVDEEEGGPVASWDADRSRQSSAESAWLVGDMLQGVVQSGTGRKASAYGATGALGGKTGTTDDARDAWFVGYTPELVVAVWVGFDRDRSLGLTGGKAALPTWSRFVSWSGTTAGSYPRPSGLHFVDGCVACSPDGSCLDDDGDWFRTGSEPDSCDDAGFFGLQPGEEPLWQAVQERLDDRRSDREVRREERRLRRMERDAG